MKRLIAITAILIIFLTVLNSCHKTTALDVCYDDCNNFRFSKVEQTARLYNEDDVFGPFFLKSKSEKLYVYNFNVEGNSNTTMIVRNGFLLGVDAGEFGGFVKFCPLKGLEDKYSEELICNENFVRFLRIDENNIILFTGLDHMGIFKGSIWLITYNTDTDKHDYRKMLDIDGEALSVVYEEGVLYVLQRTRLLKITNFEEIEELMQFDDLPIIKCNEAGFYSQDCPCSMVKIENMIYIGTLLGIYTYDVETSNMTWYKAEKR